MTDLKLVLIDLTREADFAIGGVHIRPAACEVILTGQPVRLQPRVMQVLVALARAAGRPVSREALLKLCWGDISVGEDALNRCIQKLRRLMGAEATGGFVVETIPRLGYRLCEFGASIETPQAAMARPGLFDRPSIAILPFLDFGGGGAADYFTDGMTVDIAAALSRFSTLFVIAAGTSLSYRGDARGAGPIARELGVRYVVQGSVRRSDQGVRIAVELLDAVENIQILADRFDGDLKDVFALQDAAANAIASRIEPGIRVAESSRTAAGRTEDLKAYDLYLKAGQLEYSGDRASLLEAVGLLEQAIQLDPHYALALGLAGVLPAGSMRTDGRGTNTQVVVWRRISVAAPYWPAAKTLMSWDMSRLAFT